MLSWYRNCSPSIMRHLARGILVVVVLFVLALAFVFLKGVEQLTGRVVLGTVLIVLGVFLLTAW